MAEAVVTFVLEQLGELFEESIVQEAKFLCGVNDQVNAAKDQLRRLRCFLKDADKRARGGDERVRNWVAEIREATYDLEDAILIYASQVVPRRESGARNVLKRLACLFCEGVKLHRIGSKIERIKTSISGLRESLVAWGVTELSASGSAATSSSNDRLRELRRAYSHVVEQDVVGIGEDIEKLVSVLVGEGNVPTRRVVSICGMGGLGKTTLARKVYQHSGIRCHFDRFAWVSISQQCNVSGVWKDLLRKLCPEEKGNIGENTTDDEICRKLYGILKERRCLIILDDIWTTEIWDCLSPAFPRAETNSIILVTTRNKDLVSHADVNGLNHEPSCLNEQESWELFEKAFRDSQTNLEDLEEKKTLGQEMLKHCGGLPLAIIVLRGVLSQKTTIFEWDAMRNNAKMYINDGKVTELRDSKHSGVSWVLGLSYDELPYQLKPCFLHLAHFPEDHEIRVDELCQMWMAEGLVPSEDRAYEFFKELEQRCMVQRAKARAFNGTVKTCNIHDLVRDLCLLKAEEENFLQSVTVSNREVKKSSSESDKIRRISVALDSSDDQMISIIRGHDCLRSAMFFGLSYPYPPNKISKSWFKWFHLLRVLIFGGKKTADRPLLQIPKEIGELIHFRFLSIKGWSMYRSLPSSVSKLRRLQTLDLRGLEEPLENVPKWSHCQLRHLYLPADSLLRDQKLFFENISSLRTLVGVSNSYPNFSQLAQMRNLTKMKVFVRKDWDICFTFNNLRSLTVVRDSFFDLMELFFPGLPAVGKNVVSIISSCPKIHKLKVVGGIDRLPEHSQFSAELVKVTMKDTCHESDMMPTLEKLPRLKILRLVNAFNVKKFACSKGGFPRLESLYISKLNIKEWRMEEGAFPVLRKLTLEKVLGI